MPWEVFSGTSGAELHGQVGRPTLGAESDFHPEKKKPEWFWWIKNLEARNKKDFGHLPGDVANPNLAPRCLLTWRKQVSPPLFSAGAMRSGTELRSGAFWASGLGLTRSSTRQGPRLRGTSPVFPLPASLSAISEIPAPSIFFPPGLSCVCWRQRSRSGWLRFLTVHLVLIWS